MNRVALTGGNGFIGRYVLDHLLRAGMKVRCLGRSEASLAAIGQDAEKRLTDFSMDQAVDALDGCDALVHLAGRRTLREDDPGRLAPFTESGVPLLDALLRGAKANGLKKIVQASSIAVYSPANDKPYTESASPQPVNVYGLSKYIAERQADCWSAGSGIPVIHLRIAACYGHGERDSAALMRFANQAARGEHLTVNQGGRYLIDQVYVEDVAEAFHAALLSDASGPINIGAGRCFSVLEIAEAANSAFGNEGNLTVEGSKAGEAPNPDSYMLIDRARQQIGWTPRHDLLDGMTAMRDAMRGGHAQG